MLWLVTVYAILFIKMLINSICWYKRSSFFFSVHIMARRLPSEGKSSCSQPSTLALPGWLEAGEDPFPAKDPSEWPVQRVWPLPEFTAVLGLAWGEVNSELSCVCPCGKAAVKQRVKPWDMVGCFVVSVLLTCTGFGGTKTMGPDNLWALTSVGGGSDPFPVCQ